MSMKQALLLFFSALIEQESGISYSESNFFQLENRIESLARANNCDSVENFLKLVQENKSRDLVEKIVDAATNNETLFFRDEKVFKSLQALASNEPFGEALSDKKLSIWSAACSTGQEPLSISMAMKELQPNSQLNYTILATDISQRVLDTAQRGIYSDLQVGRGLTEAHKKKFFVEIENNYWQANSAISAPITYKKLNLRSDLFPNEKFHIIFCRNVLIYQKEISKSKIVENLSRNLYPGGYLILGTGESTYGLTNKFKQIEIEGSIFYQLKTA